MDSRKLFLVLGLLFACASVFAAPWDFLRWPVTGLEIIDPITSWVVFLVSAVIFAIALIALKKKDSPRLLWVAIAFGLFFLKRLLMVIDLYVSPGMFMNDSIQGFFDLLVMLSFFVGLFRK